MVGKQKVKSAGKVDKVEAKLEATLKVDKDAVEMLKTVVMTTQKTEMTREEKAEYQARLKRAAKAPQRAEQQIRFLDQLILHLKNTRDKAGTDLMKTNKELEEVQREIDKINSRYLPAMKEMENKIAERANLRAQLASSDAAMQSILNTTKARVKRVNKTVSDFSSTDASFRLHEARGYSMGSHRMK